MSLPVGKLGSVDVRLAAWLEAEERYSRRYLPVDPQDDRVSGDRFGLTADDQIKVWRITRWVGEGETVWQSEGGRYNESSKVKPVTRGDGLVLGPQPSDTSMTDGARFGVVDGKLWVGLDDNAYFWNTATNAWSSAVATGAGAADKITSIVDSGTAVGSPSGSPGGGAVSAPAGLSGHSDGSVWAWETGGVSQLKIFDANPSGGGAGPFSYAPVLLAWRTLLFALDGDNLYEVDLSTTATRTLRVQPGGSSDDYLTDTANLYRTYRRLCAGDVGPIWWQRLDSGDTFIWQYNVGADTEEVIGILPWKFAKPDAIYSAFGFVFLMFRYGDDLANSSPGDVFMYYQRGSQRGVAGPFRGESHAASFGDVTNGDAVIAGLVGDDLIVWATNQLWAYNLSTGGVSHWGETQDNEETCNDAFVFGKQVFVAEGSSTLEVNRWNARVDDEDVASAGWLTTGAFDFDYPGLEKVLLDVTVRTDPLAANTSMTLKVSADGGSFAAVTGTHSTTNATTKTFTVSSNSGTVSGKSFELKLELATSDNADSPVVREVTARATGLEHRIEWVLAVDVGDVGEQNSEQVIDDLISLVTSKAVVQLTDPWLNEDHQTADTFDVTVEEVVLPEKRTAESSESAATVRVRSVSLV